MYRTRMSKLVGGFTLIELMIVVAIIGILAAVAIPSYQDYTGRAQVTEGVTLASAYKTTLAEFYADKGDFTAAAIANMGGTTTGKYVSSLTFANQATQTITVVSTFNTAGIHTALTGSTIGVETTDGGKTWLCGDLATLPVANLVSSRYMPGACKN